ncbi:MAG: hypothetical protein JRJ26_11415 [Deltaproteobacteria bacterium]|nr:hypothetical protein [Deltaproteobacteria bacterium]
METVGGGTQNRAWTDYLREIYTIQAVCLKPCNGPGKDGIPHLNILLSSLILSREQIDRIVEILRESITATMDDLVREGLWNG